MHVKVSKLLWSIFMNLSNKNYPKLLNKYIQVIKEIGFEKIEKTRLEFQFESLMDWSIFMSVDELKKWLPSTAQRVD